MGRKQPGENGSEEKNDAEDRDNADTHKDSTGNVVFPQQYADRLKKESAENAGRLETVRREALAGIDRDLEALGGDDHGLNPEVVDQFVTLLKTARQELLKSESFSVEQGEYLQATSKRLEALVEQVKRGFKDESTD